MCMIICPYCKSEAKLVTGERMYSYGDESWRKKRLYWECPFCLASVGCHPGTTQPLGRLADSELRIMRRETHLIFDTIWKENYMTRYRAYSWLAKRLGISEKTCHISLLSLEKLKEVQAVSKEFLDSKKVN